MIAWYLKGSPFSSEAGPHLYVSSLLWLAVSSAFFGTGNPSNCSDSSYEKRNNNGIQINKTAIAINLFNSFLLIFVHPSTIEYKRQHLNLLYFLFCYKARLVQ
jgi:hypothetical protein